MSAEYDKGADNGLYQYNNHWRPIIGSLEDRLKPLKSKEPKYEDKYCIHNGFGKPYSYSLPPIQGLYTFPYYVYGEQTLYPYQVGHGYAIKHNKEKPYVPYYKD